MNKLTLFCFLALFVSYTNLQAETLPKNKGDIILVIFNGFDLVRGKKGHRNFSKIITKRKTIDKIYNILATYENDKKLCNFFYYDPKWKTLKIKMHYKYLKDLPDVKEERRKYIIT